MRAATGVAVVLTLLAAVAPWQAPVEAQEFTQRRRSQAEIDSMVAVARERKLPFFGEAIARKGIDLPLPIGITVHSYSQVQPTTFTDLAIGFNGSEKIPLGFVSFDNASSQVWSPQFRVDAWLLPFLNVYGLVGPTRANTEVLMEEPFPLVIRTDTDAVAYGVGGTLNGGFHHYWFTATAAFAWTDVPDLTDLVNARNIGFRFGTNLDLGRVRKTLSLWVGASYQTIQSETSGVARPANLIDPAGGPVRDFIDGGYQDTEWYEDLSVVERLAADAFFDRLAGVDPSGWILEYDIQKTPIAPWGGSVGAQIDLTRAWHFMVEAGIFGPRKSLNVSLNYRFAF